MLWQKLTFSSNSPTEVSVQKKIKTSFWSNNQDLNVADKNRERRKTQDNYTGSFHKPEIHKQETSYAQAHKHETYKQTDLQRKLFEFEHLIYNQWCSQYKSDTDS